MTRPWKASAEQEREHGDGADYVAWCRWVQGRSGLARVLDDTITSHATYYACFELADAISPPPTFRARVIADFLDDCWERGSPPTPEEIEPFLRPKVRELVWEERTRFGWIVARIPEGGYRIRPKDGEWLLSGLGDQDDEAPFATAELAQAAAQAHWHERATAFWKSAFVVDSAAGGRGVGLGDLSAGRNRDQACGIE